MRTSIEESSHRSAKWGGSPPSWRPHRKTLLPQMLDQSGRDRSDAKHWPCVGGHVYATHRYEKRQVAATVRAECRCVRFTPLDKHGHLRPGNSRRSSWKRFARASGHRANSGAEHTQGKADCFSAPAEGTGAQMSPVPELFRSASMTRNAE